MTATLAAIRCPRCGGTPEPSGAPGRLARCGSCATLGRIEDDQGGQQRVVVAVSVDADFASLTAREALAARTGHDGREVRLVSRELVYVPFWRVQSVVIGRVRGRQVERDRTLEKVVLDNGQTFWSWKDREPIEQRVDRDVQKVHVAIVTACPLAEIGLPTLGRHRQTGLGLPLTEPLSSLGRIEAFDPALRKSAQVLDPLVGRPTAEGEADALLDGYRSGLGSGLLSDASVDSSVVERSVLLVYYPLYVLRFALASGRGSCVVDGARGRAATVRVPTALLAPETASETLLPLALAWGGASALRLAGGAALGVMGLGAPLSAPPLLALGAIASAAALWHLSRRGGPSS